MSFAEMFTQPEENLSSLQRVWGRNQCRIHTYYENTSIQIY